VNFEEVAADIAKTAERLDEVLTPKGQKPIFTPVAPDHKKIIVGKPSDSPAPHIIERGNGR